MTCNHTQYTPCVACQEKWAQRRLLQGDDSIIEALIKEKGRLIEENINLRKVAKAAMRDRSRGFIAPGAALLRLPKKALAALPPDLLEEKPSSPQKYGGYCLKHAIGNSDICTCSEDKP